MPQQKYDESKCRAHIRPPTLAFEKRNTVPLHAFLLELHLELHGQRQAADILLAQARIFRGVLVVAHFRQRSTAQPRAAAIFARRRSGLTAYGCPTASSIAKSPS